MLDLKNMQPLHFDYLILSLTLHRGQPWTASPLKGRHHVVHLLTQFYHTIEPHVQIAWIEIIDDEQKGNIESPHGYGPTQKQRWCRTALAAALRSVLELTQANFGTPSFWSAAAERNADAALKAAPDPWFSNIPPLIGYSLQTDLGPQNKPDFPKA
jgi:hypothetical protein